MFLNSKIRKMMVDDVLGVKWRSMDRQTDIQTDFNRIHCLMRNLLLWKKTMLWRFFNNLKTNVSFHFSRLCYKSPLRVLGVWYSKLFKSPKNKCLKTFDLLLTLCILELILFDCFNLQCLKTFVFLFWSIFLW